ncbi:hypothetical protein M0805_007435 [Coniferiporia weirii]|nr:hypothetical protein M0805_007435 [Coniferiporia weirii]
MNSASDARITSLTSQLATPKDGHGPSTGVSDDEIFAELEKDLDNDFDLGALREQRMEELKREMNQVKDLRRQDHGRLTEVKDEKEVIRISANEKKCVIHFYHRDFKRCEIMDKHLELLAPKYFATRFLRVFVEDVPWLVEKLNIRVLPCLMSFIEGVAKDRLVGFEEIGNADGFETASLELRLQMSGVIDKPTLSPVPLQTMYAASSSRNIRGRSDGDSDSDLDRRSHDVVLDTSGLLYITQHMPLCFFRLASLLKSRALELSPQRPIQFARITSRFSHILMTKRVLSGASGEGGINRHDPRSTKKARTGTKELYNKIATAENGAAVDRNPPLGILLDAVNGNVKNTGKGDAVVYWMRMDDLRIADNRAIGFASKQAQRDGIPLIVLFVISPQDYQAHDRGPRRIDFMLRNLEALKKSLSKLHIPLYTITHKPRHSVPEKVISLLLDWGTKHLFANISYELDELRRDIKMCRLGKDKGIRCEFVQDKLIVNPGILKTKGGKAYSVYSPWQKNWLAVLNNNLEWIAEVPMPNANDKSIHSSDRFSELFNSAVPEYVEGFECIDKTEMAEYWPPGTNTAMQVLEKFLHTKADEVTGKCSSVSNETSEDRRIGRYAEGRNRVDMNTSSRLSPYLTSGVISARTCIRQTMSLLKRRSIEASRDNGVGMWVQEIAWRDFYNHVMAAFPRVSMGRPYLEKFAIVNWETNEEHLQAWKDGKTGVPIVDASMRQLNKLGWMHNRFRMIVATYLTKDLMLDWRLGEKYFMENLVDGDLASNNGGWQWSASTGTDPQPYFRIFNPVSQSEKADPTGNFIRHYVPELSELSGKAIHEPPGESALKHGYPKPLVDHKFARERAIRRYKSPGEA